MRLVACLCMVAAGCSFQHGSVVGDAPMTGDGPRDAPGKDMAGCSSFSTILDTCASPPPMGGLTVTAGSWTYDTDVHVLRQGTTQVPVTTMTIDAAAGPLDVLFVTSLTVHTGATLRATGLNFDRGFGIVATGAVQIDGIIDVSNNGAGARTDAACGALTGTKGIDNNGGGGGGGGGAFQGAGGAGSKGNADGTNANGGPGGTAIAARPASPIGGCDGGRGGGNGSGGNGGDGGGALYIASATSIAVGAVGVIDAGGQGGREGPGNGDAGGGGGSGGMILLESKSVMVAGIVVANGGGGGEGNTNGNPGSNGLRGSGRAPGGKNGDANGGDGADGGNASVDGLSSNDLQNGGGGGGGGGAGFIAIACPVPNTSSAIISPAFAAWP